MMMKQQTKSNRLAYAMLGTSVLLWGGSNIVGKFVGRDLPPFTIAGIRIVLASAVLFYFLVRQEGFLLPQRRDWPMVFSLGLLGIFGANTLFHQAIQHTSPTNAALIASGSPIVITLLSTFMLRERISLRQVTGIILSFIGVVVVIIKGSWSVLVSLSLNVGDIIMLGNPICFALYTVLTKRLVDRYSPLFLGAYANLVAVMLFVPFVIYELTTLQSGINISAADVGAFAYLGLLASSIGILWWNKGIERVGASRAGIFMNGIPITAMLLSAVLLGEKITLAQIIGATMVITGVYLNSLTQQSQPGDVNEGKFGISGK